MMWPPVAKCLDPPNEIAECLDPPLTNRQALLTLNSIVSDVFIFSRASVILPTSTTQYMATATCSTPVGSTVPTNMSRRILEEATASILLMLHLVGYTLDNKLSRCCHIARNFTFSSLAFQKCLKLLLITTDQTDLQHNNLPYYSLLKQPRLPYFYAPG